MTRYPFKMIQKVIPSLGGNAHPSWLWGEKETTNRMIPLLFLKKMTFKCEQSLVGRITLNKEQKTKTQK